MSASGPSHLCGILTLVRHWPGTPFALTSVTGRSRSAAFAADIPLQASLCSPRVPRGFLPPDDQMLLEPGITEAPGTHPRRGELSPNPRGCITQVSTVVGGGRNDPVWIPSVGRPREEEGYPIQLRIGRQMGTGLCLSLPQSSSPLECRPPQSYAVLGRASDVR